MFLAVISALRNYDDHDDDDDSRKKLSKV